QPWLSTTSRCTSSSSRSWPPATSFRSPTWPHSSPAAASGVPSSPPRRRAPAGRRERHGPQVPGRPRQVLPRGQASPGALRPVPGQPPHRRRRFRQLLPVRSFGEVFNSFHDLEPDYVEHFQKTLGRRVWLVGPVALASKDMAVRGTDVPSPDAGSCLRWLDAKPSGSVVYVSFGTLTKFAPAEMHQLARALDLSGVNFVWVIGAAAGQDSSEWMPEGFADLIASGDRGFMVRGWAPQMLVLSHPALGGFVTHCGWNSVLEAVTAGVPMVTWPRYADQFNNEKLVVELLKVGVSIGAKDYASGIQAHEVIAGEVIAESIQRLMEGDDIQKKAKDLGLKARSAVEKGGSSYDDVGRLMDVLTARRSSVKIGEDIQLVVNL
uniref:Uncharacterized protein n=1 Tax=Aegilops tauschii subsp. strangulata TaxID=200361 RepID=A0A453M1Q3_AEGTS